PLLVRRQGVPVGRDRSRAGGRPLLVGHRPGGHSPVPSSSTGPGFVATTDAEPTTTTITSPIALLLDTSAFPRRGAAMHRDTRHPVLTPVTLSGLLAVLRGLERGSISMAQVDRLGPERRDRGAGSSVPS